MEALGPSLFFFGWCSGGVSAVGEDGSASGVAEWNDGFEERPLAVV